MSVMATKNALKLKRVTRHSWGPQPTRVVVVTLVESEVGITGTVWGAEGGSVVAFETKDGATIRRQRGPVTIDFADGTSWTLGGVGCSCNVPGPLRGFNPLRAG